MLDAPDASTPVRSSPVRHIATLQEGPLHAALKTWYAEPGDRHEVPVAGRQIDLVRGDLLIEIQTGSFAAIRRKLTALVQTHRVRLVYPVPAETWIVRVDGRARVLGRRRSPRRGRLEQAFRELVSLPALLAHPAFSFEILLTREDEVRRHSPGRAWHRKGWVVVERRLIDVVSRHVFRRPDDLSVFLPPDLPPVFTTGDLARGLGVDRDLAQKMAYCLRAAGVIAPTGKVRNAIGYRRRTPVDA
ncbi:MAG: hypothetical protein AB7O93_19530 [Vicinamibacterales bacterium]